MFDWSSIIDSVLSYIADIGSTVGGWFGDAGSWLGDVLGGGGEGALASAYGPEAASYLGDVESGLGGAGGGMPSYAIPVSADVGDYTGVGSQFYGGGVTDIGGMAGYDIGSDLGTSPYTYAMEPVGGFDSPVGGDWAAMTTPSDELGLTNYDPGYDYYSPGGDLSITRDTPNVPGGPTGTTTSDYLRSRAADTSGLASNTPTPGAEPFTGLTADPLSSIPGGNIPDWLKAAAQMAGNFAKGAFGGGGGGGGGGMDPNLLAALGRGGGVPGVGPAGTPSYLGVGGIPQGGEGQMAPGGGLGNVPGGAPGGGNQQFGSPGNMQGIGTPQMANVAGQAIGSPNTFGAPPPRNLNPFTPMMIPLPQAPLYPGIQQQPMSGLQRLMMAG